MCRGCTGINIGEVFSRFLGNNATFLAFRVDWNLAILFIFIFGCSQKLSILFIDGRAILDFIVFSYRF